MAIVDKDGAIVLGNDDVVLSNNITLKTTNPPDGTLSVHTGTPSLLGPKVAEFNSDGLTLDNVTVNKNLMAESGFIMMKKTLSDNVVVPAGHVVISSETTIPAGLSIEIAEDAVWTVV